MFDRLTVRGQLVAHRYAQIYLKAVWGYVLTVRGLGWLVFVRFGHASPDQV